jgi:ZIP family zinc transporter
MVATGTDVAFAFGLSFAAGLSTCLGGLLLFCKCLVSVTKPASLGISLAVSAGVMIFISLTEIFNLSVHYFKDSFAEETITINLASSNLTMDLNNNKEHAEKVCDSVCKGHGWSAASASFLGGVVIIILLDFIVHKISPDTDEEFDPKELEMLHKNDAESATTKNWSGSVKDTIIKHPEDGKLNGYLENQHVNNQILNSSTDVAERKARSEKKELNRMGVLTALAVGIHNLPEGIATYIAAKNGSRLGATMAIGIALHNIPEGIAIATPVYFATGSKCKAFAWTLVAGLAEPIGSIICWLAVGDGLNPLVEGVIYGIVSGMMVTVSFKDLIPTSLKYNTNINVFISSMLGGMAIMIISLILFAYAGL